MVGLGAEVTIIRLSISSVLREALLHRQPEAAPDLAPAYGSDAGGEAIWHCWADNRGDPRKQHGKVLPGPRHAGIAGVIDPDILDGGA